MPFSRKEGTKFVKSNVPSIFLNPGEEAFPCRCPACGSDSYIAETTTVDEQNTYALFPTKQLDFRYQRYSSILCVKCNYRYYFRPKGEWLNKESLALGFKKQYLTDNETTLPLGKQQDARIIKLAKIKRYSTKQLNPNITSTEIALLIGAGFSYPLGMPITGNFQPLLTSDFISQLMSWLAPYHGTTLEMLKDPYLYSVQKEYERAGDLGKPRKEDEFQEMFKKWTERTSFVEKALNDPEILMDVLLRLQRIAVLYPKEENFIKYVRTLRNEVESIFVFRESFFRNGCYPPITQTEVYSKNIANMSSKHFKRIRELMVEAITIILKNCSHIPSGKPTSAIIEYKGFLDKLSKLNMGPLPIFTTNYDLCIEDIFSVAGESQRLITGLTGKDGPNVGFTEKEGFFGKRNGGYATKEVSFVPYLTCSNNSIPLFHIHGCSSWLVNKEKGMTVEFDTKNLENILRQLWLPSTPWIPAAIFPATVKEAYTLSPPFETGYDYLAQSLLHAKIVIIVGYSGRDITIKEIIQWAKKENLKLKFIVIGGNSNNLPVHLGDVLPIERTMYLSGGLSSNIEKVLELCESP